MQVLQPHHIVLAHKAVDIAKYGNEDINILAQHFGSQKIDKDEVTAEYKQYKRLCSRILSFYIILGDLWSHDGKVQWHDAQTGQAAELLCCAACKQCNMVKRVLNTKQEVQTENHAQRWFN